jgi:valyl-tRNA synthetase
MDRWLLSEFDKAVEQATSAFEDYNYSEARRVAENFFWHIFCDNYLEIAKYRLYDAESEAGKSGEAKSATSGKKSAQQTLHIVFLGILKLFAPILPFITEELYSAHYANQGKSDKSLQNMQSIHSQKWPVKSNAGKDELAEKLGSLGISIISEARKYKAAKSMSMKQEIESVVAESNIDFNALPTYDAESFKKDIMNTVKSKNLEFLKSDETKINIS